MADDFRSNNSTQFLKWIKNYFDKEYEVILDYYYEEFIKNFKKISLPLVTLYCTGKNTTGQSSKN